MLLPLPRRVLGVPGCDVAAAIGFHPLVDSLIDLHNPKIYSGGKTPMPLDQETLAKLTKSLAGDTELYNKVINEVQQNDAAISEKEQEIQTTKAKLEEAEQRGQQYLGQISNLLSKIPVGNTAAPQSLDQKMEEIRQRSWTKENK